MDTDSYKAFVLRNALGGQRTLEQRAFYMLLEAAEVGNEVKRITSRDGGHLTVERHKMIIEEMGDQLYYFFLVMDSLGLTLSQVMEANVHKLEERYGRKQSPVAVDRS